jgi:hypothetical protein
MPHPGVHLDRYRTLARALDARFGIPGTPLRFGWDSIIGLIPGIGDAAGGILGSYGLYVATRLGAPPVVMARMLFNVALDLVLGTVPVLGDMFDLAWRSNLRNLALLERWLERPHETGRRSAALFLTLVALLAGLAAASVWLTFRLLHYLAPGVG